MRKTIFLITALTIISCSNNKNNDITQIESEPSSYEMMSIAFENSPSEDEIKPLLEEVMGRYGLEINEENLQNAGSVLVTLRKQSKVGVTEMEILKHIYQNGSNNTNYQTQASLSFTTLEMTK